MLFPEGVNVLPNAVVKSVSVSGNRLLIKLKDGRKVNGIAGTGSCSGAHGINVLIMHSQTGGDRSHRGCSGPGAQRGTGQVSRAGGGFGFRGVPSERGAAGALQHLGGE